MKLILFNTFTNLTFLTKTYNSYISATLLKPLIILPWCILDNGTPKKINIAQTKSRNCCLHFLVVFSFIFLHLSYNMIFAREKLRVFLHWQYNLLFGIIHNLLYIYNCRFIYKCYPFYTYNEYTLCNSVLRIKWDIIFENSNYNWNINL